MYRNFHEDLGRKMAMAARMAVTRFFANMSRVEILKIDSADFSFVFPANLSRHDQDFVEAVKVATILFVEHVKQEESIKVARAARLGIVSPSQVSMTASTPGGETLLPVSALNAAPNPAASAVSSRINPGIAPLPVVQASRLREANFTPGYLQVDLHSGLIVTIH